MTIISTSTHDSVESSLTTESEDSDEEGTGNTGKHKPRCCWHETNLRNSDELPSFIEAARKMETLFEAKLLTTDASKGRGGCDGLRFKCSNNHEFTTSFDKIAKFV